jgi:hypothetical protein
MLTYSLDKFSRNINPDVVNKHKTVTIHEFPGGVEVFLNEAAESYQDMCVYEQVERAARGEGDREENKDRVARRAKTQVRRRCKMIQADCMLTLTYRELVIDESRVQADLKALVKRFRSIGAFEYVAALETQKRGALHVHIACQQFPVYMKNEHGVRVKSYNLIRSMWRRIVGADNGNVDLTRPRGRNSAHRIATYIGKYVGKGLENADFNKKSYWSSKGIVMPKPTKIFFDRDMSTWDIIVLLCQDFQIKGLTDIAQYSDRLGEFYWFSASKPST